jgi:hypothetical protein
MRQMEGPLLTPPDANITSKEALVAYTDRRRSRGELGSFFQIVATISTFEDRHVLLKALESWRFKVVNQYGDLYDLEAKTKDKVTGETKIIPFFMFFDRVELVHLFMTRATKTDEMPDTLLSFVNATKDISLMWIPPSSMHELKCDLNQRYGHDFQLSYFTAVRNANTKTRARWRPRIDRTFQYTGVDAKATLDELENLYGVFPKILEVRMRPDSRFRIDDKCILTLRPGCEIGVVFTVLDIVKNRVKAITNAVRRSQTALEDVGGIERCIQYPWSIDMETGIRAGLEDHFLAEIRKEPWCLMPIIPYVEEGVPFLSSRFVDCKKNSSFDLELTKKRARVYPVDRMDVGTALRLFQFVSLNEDIQATVGL